MLIGGMLMSVPAKAFIIVSPESITQIHIDTPTLLKGYTVVTENQKFFIGVRPEVLAVESGVVLKQYDSTQFEFPEGLTAVSQVYEFDIQNKESFRNEKPLLMKMYLDEPTSKYKNLYFYNGVIDKWVVLPTDIVDDDVIKSVIHLPYAKMVVLEGAEAMTEGAASWYSYKRCNCAASPDYPKGSVLRVTNLENNKFVDVTVNDYGPDRTIHPERVIDLDKVAFLQLGELWQGILPKVKVERLR